VELDPLIHQATRLRVVALLARNREAPFTWIQETLGLTSGNLDSHVQRLAEAGYLESRRALTPAGFQARVAITPAGDAAYQAYLAALRAVLEGEREG
jgi:DNA-binding MarR family transcriptional regulator